MCQYNCKRRDGKKLTEEKTPLVFEAAFKSAGDGDVVAVGHGEVTTAAANNSK
jgi:hypothetical protein